MDRELLEFNDEFGSELKKSFEKEFDVNDISVSDDLIARTMAAIRAAGDDSEQAEDAVKDSGAEADVVIAGNLNAENNKDNVAKIEKQDNSDPGRRSKVLETEKNDIEKNGVAQSDSDQNITDISRAPRRSMVVKWVSGIAAALFLGVVVFFVIKIGIGGYSKKESSANMAFAPNSVEYDNASEARQEDRYEESVSEPKSDTAEAGVSKYAESMDKRDYAGQDIVSDESYKLSDDYKMEDQLESKYSTGVINGKNNLCSETIKSDDISDGSQTIGFNASGSSNEKNEEYENTPKDNRDDEVTVTADDSKNDGKDISTDNSDNNDKTDTVKEKNSVAEQVGDERDNGYILSEEEIDILMGQFILSLDADVKESLSGETDLTAEKQESLTEAIRTTEWYELLAANKNEAVDVLVNLYENTEDRSKMLLIEILLNCVSEEGSN